MKAKTKKKGRTILILILTIGLAFGLFYWSTHSDRGFKFTWGRLASLVPGRLDWEKFELNFTHRTLQIRNLSYTLPNGNRLLELDLIDGKFRWDSLFRTRAMFQNLEVKGLTLDLSVLPPRKGPSPFAKVMKSLTRRLAIAHSELKDITIRLKNGQITLPEGELSYWPSVIGKDQIRLHLKNIEGGLADQPLKLESLNYEGTFSVPDIFKQVFLFREASGTLTLQGAQFGPWKLNDLSTEASFDGETIEFKGLDITVAGGRYHLQTKFAPFDQHLEGTLASDGDIEWEDIPGFREKLARAYDKVHFKLDFDLTGFSFKEMEGKFALDLKAIGNQINPKTPTVQIQLASPIKNGRFDFSQFLIRSERTQMSGKGFVDLGQMKLNMALSGTGMDLRTLISMFSDLELYGYADFAGDIKGDLKNPDFRFQGKAVESGYKFLRFGENGGSFEILNGQMRYIGRSPSGASYTDSVDVMTQNLFDGTKRHTVLKTSFNNIDVSSLLENPAMTGKVSGTWDMETWPGDKRNGKLVASVKDYHLYQFHIGDMDTVGILEGQIFRFPELNFHPPGIETLKTPRETVFTFDDAGFKFKGSPIAGMDVEGGYIYKRVNVLDIKASCRDCATPPLLASIEEPAFKGSVDGRIDMQLIMGNFDNSKMDAQIDHLEVPVGEGTLSQSGPIKITYRQGFFHLDQVSLAYNKGVFRLLGAYSTDKPLDLNLKGDLDLSLLKAFKEQVRDASGLAKLDLKIKGKKDAPSITGDIVFDRNTLTLRAFPNAIENLKGRISLDEQKISSERLEGSISDGDLILSGTVWRDGFKIKKADLKAEAREIGYSEPGTYKLILSGKVFLTGEAPNFLLSGNLDITEGRYIKNFDIRDFILKPALTVPVGEAGGGGFDNLKLDLSVKSPGDLEVKNNIAEIFLKSDLKITGTKAKPLYEGAVEVLDGKFNYFRLSFENAKGFIDFRNPQEGHPYVDMTAQKLFERPSEDVTVVAHVTGYTDNLQLSFTSDPPLEKREILTLIFTGALPEERRSISGGNIASSVLASQLTTVLEQPVTGFTHLDIFRLEAPDPDSKALTSLVVGKKITERLSLEFKTDLNIEDSIKSVQAEYLLFDNVLLKASRITTSKYRLELTFRFRGY